MKGFDIVTIGYRTLAAFYFDADDCEAVAATLSPRDAWADDLLKAAQELRERGE